MNDSVANRSCVPYAGATRRSDIAPPQSSHSPLAWEELHGFPVAALIGGPSVASEDFKLATLRFGDNQQRAVRSRKHLRWLPLCFKHARRYAQFHSPILDLGVESMGVK